MTPDAFKTKLLECLGGPWPNCGPLDARVERTTQCDGFRIERISYLAEPDERVASLLLIPDGLSPQRRAPGICVWHQHNDDYDLGKEEPAGLAGDPRQFTGVEFARMGYVVLCPDALGFSERRPSKVLNGGALERFLFLKYVVRGKCLAWKNILDMRRHVDLLASRPEVNVDKLGCYGHSMGSTFTWLVGPFEPRLKALAGNCCLPTYAGIERELLLHCFPNFIPGIYQYGDHPEIAALIAPRPLLISLGERDAGSPIAEARAGCERIAAAYRAIGAADCFMHVVEPGAGHELTPAMLARIKAFFTKHLSA